MEPSVNDRIAPRGQRRDLDRYVRARHLRPGDHFQPGCSSRRHRRRQVAGPGRGTCLVGVGLGLRHARLAQKVDAEGNPVVPHPAEIVDALAASVPAMNLLAIPVICLEIGLRPCHLAQFQRCADRSGNAHTRLRQIVLEVVEDLFRSRGASGRPRTGTTAPEVGSLQDQFSRIGIELGPKERRPCSREPCSAARCPVRGSESQLESAGAPAL